MQFPCARCGRSYEIADELCVGRAVKVACPACGHLAVHRVAASGGSPAPAAPPPPPQVPPSFAEADDDDFESAWSALEAPAEPPAAPGPRQGVAPAPPATRAPSPPPKPAAKPAARRPSPPPRSLEEEEPVMVTAELVIRRSARRARMTAAVVALLAVAAVGGGGYYALKFKRSGTLAGEKRRVEGTAETGSASALSAADLARLMGRQDAEPRPARPVQRAPAADRPKHAKLAASDRDLLDLLKKKGDAAVKVQEEDLGALATTRASLDEQAIEGTLSRSSGSFMACVTRAIQASPDRRLPATKVNLELTIRPSGRVSKAAVQEDGIAKLPLGQCIAQAAKRMVFPGFDGEPLDIVVPLKLKVGL